MTGTTPRVSISMLFLTLDRPTKVHKCFHSLRYLLHNKDVKEWLILDNNSQQATRSYLEKFAKRSPKVKYYQSDTNLGVAGGRDYLMNRAQGDHFLVLDSDVIDKEKQFLPDLKRAMARPNTGIVGLHGANVNQDW
jgi:GT2 family glycosyltransferase